MESARVIHINRGRGYGFAKVVVFKSREITIDKYEEIIFHFGGGYKMRPGRRKPRFNYKIRIKKFPVPGEYIVFVRKKIENGNLRDKAAVWGLRKQYKEIWNFLDRRKKQQEKLLKISQLLQQIEIERSLETRKAL